MHIQSDKLTQIVNLSKKHRVLAIGEIHGVRQNPQVVLEVINALKKDELVVGLEYPQTVIDNPDSVDGIYFQDGRFSVYHKAMIETLKDEGVELFGFDIYGDQLKEQSDLPLDWRDKKMAENINKKLSEISSEKKILLVCGDIHYQTKAQNFMYPDKDGVMKPTPFLPMASQTNTPSILAIHLRYLSGSFYNFKLKTMPKIDVNKEFSFREADDVVEVDVAVATPTQN